jgi:predicted nucleic acid-binding Zn finger protein
LRTSKIKLLYPSSSGRSGEKTSEQAERLRAKFPQYAKYGTKLDRAIGTVLAGGVKESRFLPSGRKVITVVGRLGDEFIDPDRPYCSCSNFFFRVLGGREETCYHLLSYRIASETGRLDVVKFSDEEYGAYLAATVRDVFEVLRRSAG